MRLIHREALDAQTSAKQPPWVVLIAIYLTVNWSLEAVWYVACWSLPALVQWGHSNYGALRMIWFPARLALVLLSVYLLASKFRTSLFGGVVLHTRSALRLLGVSLLCAFPLSLLHLARFAEPMLTMSRFIASAWGSPLTEEMLHFLVATRNTLWGGLGWGTDALGVCLASVMLLIVPLYEECLLTGSVLNRLSRLLRLRLAIPCVVLLFSLLHFNVEGWAEGWHLLCLTSVSCIAARLWSGSWLAGYCTHVLLNLVILLPRWWFLWATRSLLP